MQQNQLVCCPYNTQHQMHPNRLIFHISRECKERKMNKHMYRHCPFNFLHIFRGEEIEQHISICPDKIEIQNDIFTEEPLIQTEIPQGDSNWGLNQQQQMSIEPKINQQQDNELIDQFNNLKLQRQDDIWDQLWKQQQNNDDEFDML